MKKNLSKFYLQYRLYIFPAVVALSSLVLIILIILPQISALLTNQKKQAELSNKFNNLEVKAKALENYDSEDLARKLQYALSSYPDDKDFGNAIGIIQNIVAQAGFTINTISLSSGGKLTNSSSSSYNIKLEVSGPRNLLGILFTNIENSPRLMRLSDVEVTNSSSQQSSIVAMNLAVLYAPGPQSFGDVDSPLPQLSVKEEELISKLVGVSTIPSAANVQLPTRGRANPFE